MRARPCSGFTLIEMVIAVAVFGILVMAALPSFRVWTQNTQIRTISEGMLNGLQFARAEAVRRNTKIELVLADDSSWVARVEGTTQAIQSRGANEGGSAAVTISPGGATKATFDGLGRVVNNADGSASITEIKVDSSVLPPADSRELCITVGSGGVVRLCDPNVAAGDTRACLPSVPAGCAP